jgi:hypothetical protein
LDSIDLLEEAYKIGRNNDQKYFKDLVSKPMAYNVVFSFGDDVQDMRGKLVISI